MDVLSNINRARSLAYVSEAQYSNAKALEDLNVIYKLICSIIIQNVDENYFSDFIVTTLVNGQNEYILEDEANGINVNKIGDVFIKYSDNEDYVKATRRDKFQLEKDLSYYNENTSKSNPFFFVYENSIFIYPALNGLDVNEGLKLNAALTPVDLAIDGLESDILLEKEYHYILSLGMIPLIYQRRGLLNEKAMANKEYEEELTNLIIRLSDRVNGATTFEMPNLSYYE